MPTTSILIVTYNCADVIQQCIQSALNEDNAECIVIDNASTDKTLQVIDAYKGQLSIIKNKINRGFTQACNQGIKKAQGKYILLLNPDAWLGSKSLNYLVQQLDTKPKLGAIAPMLKYPDGSFQNYTRRFPSVMGLWVETFIPMRWWNHFKSYRKYTCQDIDFTTDQDVDQPAGAALLFRKQWKLDEHYFIYGSDVDLCQTIKKDNYQIVQTPDAIVYHHQSKGGTENNKLRLFLDLDNYYGMKYYFKKFDKNGQYLAYSFFFAITLFVRVLVSAITLANDLSMRWVKFTGFIQNKNFRSINV